MTTDVYIILGKHLLCCYKDLIDLHYMYQNLIISCLNKYEDLHQISYFCPVEPLNKIHITYELHILTISDYMSHKSFMYQIQCATKTHANFSFYILSKASKSLPFEKNIYILDYYFTCQVYSGKDHSISVQWRVTWLNGAADHQIFMISCWVQNLSRRFSRHTYQTRLTSLT